jgi:hypothetical protein
MRPTAIWIDHHEARVFHVGSGDVGEDTIKAAHAHIHRHPKPQEMKTRNHPDDEARFFDEVLAAVGGSDAILLLGPSVTKLRFLRHARNKAPGVEAAVVGVETADHPTDRELMAHVRHYFHEDAPRLGVVAR